MVFRAVRIASLQVPECCWDMLAQRWKDGAAWLVSWPTARLTAVVFLVKYWRIRRSMIPRTMRLREHAARLLYQTPECLEVFAALDQ